MDSEFETIQELKLILTRALCLAQLKGDLDKMIKLKNTLDKLSITKTELRALKKLRV